MTEFRVVAVYPKYDRAKDDALFKAAGRPSAGSGYGGGERDHEWEFMLRTAALECVERLRAVNIPGLKVYIDEVR